MSDAIRNVSTSFAFEPKTGYAGRVFRERTEPLLPHGRPPRISRMMALAIHLQELIDSGKVKDFTSLADAGQVSRARITQIMNLNMLAPDIQESILFLSEIKHGRDKLNEKQLRVIASKKLWKMQRLAWRELLASAGIQNYESRTPVA